MQQLAYIYIYAMFYALAVILKWSKFLSICLEGVES